MKRSTLQSLGEFGLIAKIRKDYLPSLQTRGLRPEHTRQLILGIGDDAAIFRPTTGFDLLLTTDLLLEGVHFQRNVANLVDIGYKAVMVNASDIAAMGGIPKGYLVSLALPPSFQVKGVQTLYRGMQQAASKLGLAMLGGNTACCPDRFFIDVTLVGEVERGRAITRSGAQVGDLLFVTGTLGDSSAGLSLLKGRDQGVSSFPFLIRRHLRPTARWREGRTFAGVASAMIDLSDGLSSDLHHLCDESGVGAVVKGSFVPLSRPLRSYSNLLGKDPLGYALDGGEDYELLFTVPRRRLKNLKDLVGAKKVRATRIGEIVPRKQKCSLEKMGVLTPLRPEGYQHFR